MMRVPEASILDKSAYTYYTGLTAGVAQWSTDSTAATNVFPDTRNVGEPSYYYHPGTGLYVASYLEESTNTIVLRTAPNPWGPWSDTVTVLAGSQFGNADMYGGFIHPWSNVSTGAAATGPGGTVTTSVSSGSQSANDFYFHISLFTPYATYLMKASITGPGGFLPFMG